MSGTQQNRRSTRTTLFDKIWQRHLVIQDEDGTCLIWVDRHLIHEVTSPQAFTSLRASGRGVRCPELTLAIVDHNVSTLPDRGTHPDPTSKAQMEALRQSCQDFGIEHIDLFQIEQGIVHVVGPEQGFTLPGTVVACGDSHTSTHGAFGALAFGIGTSEVEQVLATQCLWLRRPKTMYVRIEGRLGFSVTAKDIALTVSAALPDGGARGFVMEYGGSTVRGLSMESRMTLCNMAVEAGARAALIAPDEVTFEYLHGRPRAPTGEQWARARADWKMLHSEGGACFDREIVLDASAIAPLVSWGTSPEDVAPITGIVPSPSQYVGLARQERVAKALDYMNLIPGTKLEDIEVQNVFIGSCTNGRIEDLRSAAQVVAGRKVAANVRNALVVPGSGLVKGQAEREGLDRVFRDAGFEWREAGCSMCVAINADRVPPGERCASTSNRSFVGRQGPGSRTHLMSPPMAAAAAISGRLTDVRKLVAAAETRVR